MKRTDSETSTRMKRVARFGTAPEKVVAKVLRSNAIRFRIHDSTLAGRPDFSVPAARSAIFVNGCFWHRHSKRCPRTTTPKRNRAFWLKKFAANVARDRRNASLLRRQGWHVYVVWECSLERAQSVVNRIVDFLEEQ